jgi:hypothetical protein
MCTEGFTCLPESTCKPLRIEYRLRLRNTRSGGEYIYQREAAIIENIIIDEQKNIINNYRRITQERL